MTVEIYEENGVKRMRTATPHGNVISMFGSNPNLSPQKREEYRLRAESKTEAEAFLTERFGQHNAWVIVANVMANFTTKNRKSAKSFEEAWHDLGFQVVTDIIYRTLNDLPAEGNIQL